MKNFRSVATLAFTAIFAIMTSCSEEEIAKETLAKMTPEAIVLEDVEMEDLEDLIAGQIESVTVDDVESFSQQPAS